MRSPSAEECAAPALDHVRHIVERWLLLEYACCFLPVQPLAVVTDVAPAELSVSPSAADISTSPPPPKLALFNCQLLIVNRHPNRKSLRFLRLPPFNGYSINACNAPTKCTSAWFKMGTC